MVKNTTVSLGSHFEHFVKYRIAEGRYTDTSEVISEVLRLLEEEENRILILKNAIQ